jgi:hypothetical protein
VKESAPVGTQERREEHDNLPVPLTGMVGRTEVVAALVAQLSSHRFITIAGPGGIGKTSVAVAVAHGLRSHFPDGIQFAELAPLASPDLLPSSVCALLGVPPRSDNLLPVLLAFLRGNGCSSCSTAASTLSRPPPLSQRRFLRRRRKCISWPQAANHCARRESACSACRHLDFRGREPA